MSKHDLVQGYMYIIPLVSNKKSRKLKSKYCLKNIKIGTSWIRYKNMMKLKWPTFVYHVYIAAILYEDCTTPFKIISNYKYSNIVLNQWNENSLDKHTLFTSQWNSVFLHSKPTKLNWTHVDCHTVYTHMRK